MLKGCYQKNKGRLSKKSCKRCQNLSEGEKGKKPQYASEWCRNFSEEEKEKKCQYGCERYKNTFKGWKSNL